jgi:hypothetical protein
MFHLSLNSRTWGEGRIDLPARKHTSAFGEASIDFGFWIFDFGLGSAVSKEQLAKAFTES